jgi:microcystin-dependent protein
MGIFSLPAVIINSGPDFTGCIVMWLGSVGSIPSGWALCDGNNGTPNLTGKFLYGWDTANSIDIGDTGGTTDRAHIHSVSSDGSHTHTTGGG